MEKLEMRFAGAKFWLNRKVLVTGHTGFKGGWLSLWLSMMGAKVTGYSLPPTYSPNIFDKLDLSNRIHKSIIEDIRNFSALADAVDMAQPEIIFHMAAQPLVRHSYLDPIQTFSTNVMGTANLLEIARSVRSLRAIIVVTTDKCYENNEEKQSFKESDKLGGKDPYSASKACAEIVTAAYQNSYYSASSGYNCNATSVASVRAGNVFGGGDWSTDRLIPDVIRASIKNQPLLVRQPQSIRPWQFVLDPLYGYLLLAQGLCEGGKAFQGAWNFGPQADAEISVSQFLNLFIDKWGDGIDWVYEGNVDSGFYEAKVLNLDISKSRRELGWKPLTPINKGIEYTVEWYKSSQNSSDQELMVLSEAQIMRYMDAL